MMIWLYNLATGNSLSEFIGIDHNHGYTRTWAELCLRRARGKDGIADLRLIGVICATLGFTSAAIDRRHPSPLVRPWTSDANETEDCITRIPDRHHGRSPPRPTDEATRLNHRHADFTQSPSSASSICITYAGAGLDQPHPALL